MRKIFLISISLYMGSSLCSAQQDIEKLLIARNTGVKGLANFDTIRVFGFAEGLMDQPGVPGPTIVANEGDSVHIDLWNVSQGAPHTIHLHGLDVDQQNDGVPHLSFDVPHMEHGFYHFKAPHAGTYLYHCHVASTVHVQAGMYGLIIIKPTDGSNTTWNGGHAFDQEYSYFLSEIDTMWHKDGILMHDHDTTLAIHYVEIPKFEPQFFLINGRSDQQLVSDTTEFTSSIGEVNYVRLANIGYCGTRIIFPPEFNARIVASDGRPLGNEELSDTVDVFPGERFGVLVQPSIEMTSQIEFQYVDLNTMNVKNSQFIPVRISEFSEITNHNSEQFSFDVIPNPIDANAIIKFTLPKISNIEIHVYDTKGMLVAHVENKRYGAGTSELVITELIPKKGNFLVQLTLNGNTTAVKKVIRL